MKSESREPQETDTSHPSLRLKLRSSERSEGTPSTARFSVRWGVNFPAKSYKLALESLHVLDADDDLNAVLANKAYQVCSGVPAMNMYDCSRKGYGDVLAVVNGASYTDHAGTVGLIISSTSLQGSIDVQLVFKKIDGTPLTLLDTTAGLHWVAELVLVPTP